jgi:hypothetical protein
VSHYEAAIRHAVIALGSLHQGFIQDQSSPYGSNQKADPERFAVHQYTKAIDSLVQPMRERGKQAADVPLIACVLFILLEVSNTKKSLWPLLTDTIFRPSGDTMDQLCLTSTAE